MHARLTSKSKQCPPSRSQVKRNFENAKGSVHPEDKETMSAGSVLPDVSLTRLTSMPSFVGASAHMNTRRTGK